MILIANYWQFPEVLFSPLVFLCVTYWVLESIVTCPACFPLETCLFSNGARWRKFIWSAILAHFSYWIKVLVGHASLTPRFIEIRHAIIATLALCGRIGCANNLDVLNLRRKVLRVIHIIILGINPIELVSSSTHISLDRNPEARHQVVWNHVLVYVINVKCEEAICYVLGNHGVGAVTEFYYAVVEEGVCIWDYVLGNAGGFGRALRGFEAWASWRPSGAIACLDVIKCPMLAIDIEMLRNFSL